MSMQTDVKAAHLNAAGVAVAGRTRIKGFVCTATATNTEVTLYDDAAAATGNVLMQFDTGTVQTTFQILLPGEGILAQNGVYVAFSAVGVTLTVIYG